MLFVLLLNSSMIFSIKLKETLFLPLVEFCYINLHDRVFLVEGAVFRAERVVPIDVVDCSKVTHKLIL